MVEPAPGVVIGTDGVARCFWGASNPLYVEYHDNEWGFPVASDERLFEKLCLEGFQSGLSWLIILRKREGFRRAFAGFDAARVAGFSEADVSRLMADTSIVRNRRKIEATIGNARLAVQLASEHGSLAAFLWRYEPGLESRPERITPDVLMGLASTRESVALSRELKRRGWGMIGPTTAYSFMQAVGMVNDHLEDCAARARVEDARRRFVRPSWSPS